MYRAEEAGAKGGGRGEGGGGYSRTILQSEVHYQFPSIPRAPFRGIPEKGERRESTASDLPNNNSILSDEPEGFKDENLYGEREEGGIPCDSVE